MFSLPKLPKIRFSRIALCALFFCCVLVIAQTISLVGRVQNGGTDFSVFYNTAKLLQGGAGAEIYSRTDAETGWLITIPPFGQALVQPLAWFSPTVAAVLWGAFNLVLLLASLLALRSFLGRMDRQQRLYARAFPWMAVLLLFLSAGSLQVGQWSVFFTACWIFFLNEASKRRDSWAGGLLAIPAAVKLYPLLLLAVPIFVGKSRQIIGLIAGLVFCFVLPILFYGARTAPLTTTFFQDVILNPQGRVAESQTARSTANQGLDAVMLRALSYDARFHGRKYPHYPHLSLDHDVVISLAGKVRLALLALTLGVAWRWRRAMSKRLKAQSFYMTLQMAALWCSTLYLLLPGAKARYAVYVFLGFLPLLAAIVAMRRRNEYSKSAALCGFTIVCALFVSSSVPELWRAYNAGFIGAGMLWCANLGGLLHQAAQARKMQARKRRFVATRQSAGTTASG